MGAAGAQEEGKNKALISVPSSLHNGNREGGSGNGGETDRRLQPFLTQAALTSLELS